MITKKVKYDDGDHVQLSAFDDQPRQAGTVAGTPSLQHPRMYIIHLDNEYIDEGGYDDGVRELSIDQIEGVIS